MDERDLAERRLHPGNGLPQHDGAGLPPLRVSGVVVSHADLVEALRIYVPGLREIRVTEDGQDFWLMVNEGERDAD